MSIETLPDWRAVGARVGLARRTLNLTQAELAARIGIDRTALAKIESGSRNLNALELAALARATGLPIDWFVTESALIATSRRDVGQLGDPGIVDLRLEVLARDVMQLRELDLLRLKASKPEMSMPRDVGAAERAATTVRAHLDGDSGPLTNLTSAAESLGLLAYSLALPTTDADGAYVALDSHLGVALLNGEHPSARRRFTLAHEIGHHIFQDAYVIDVEAPGRSETERILDAFAIHLLLPRTMLEQRWSELGGGDDPRSAAIVIGAEYRVSWTALCGHLVNLGLLDRPQGEIMRADLPRGGEYAELGIDLVEELGAPMVPRAIARAALRGYRTRRLGAGRTLELLCGKFTEADLPDRDEIPRAALAGSCAALEWSGVRLRREPAQLLRSR